MRFHLLDLAFLLFLLTACAPAAPVCETPGTLAELDVESFGRVVIYLPPCYSSQPQAPYPVLYLMPGIGGGAHSWVNAGAPGVFDNAIFAGDTLPFLAVMTADTFAWAAPEELPDILVSYIESHYPVSRARCHRAIAGGSLGAASAYLLTFRHPDLFSSAGVFGNGLITGQEKELRALLAAIPDGAAPRLFLNSGENDPYMLQQAHALIPLLDEVGIEHTDVFDDGKHDYVSWLANFPAYLRWLADGWK